MFNQSPTRPTQAGVSPPRPIPVSSFDIWFAILPEIPGSHVQQGLRPVIVVSNDLANRYSPCITVVPLTSREKKPLPTHVRLEGYGLPSVSQALCEQIISLDKSRLTKRLDCVDSPEVRASIHTAMAIQLAMAA